MLNFIIYAVFVIGVVATCQDGEYSRHSDCTKFKQCANGVFVVKTCPNKLHWSVKESQCDWPAKAGCTTSNDSSETCKDGEFRPHSDCTKFKQCANGVFVVKTCPNKLHWSVQESKCDWPANAGCTSESEGD